MPVRTSTLKINHSKEIVSIIINKHILFETRYGRYHLRYEITISPDFFIFLASALSNQNTRNYSKDSTEYRRPVVHVQNKLEFIVMDKPPIEEKTREEVEAERKAKRAAKQERKKAALEKQKSDGLEIQKKSKDPSTESAIAVDSVKVSKSKPVSKNHHKKCKSCLMS